MKTSCFVFALLASTLIGVQALVAGINATTTANQTAIPAPTVYSVVANDANSRVWERTIYEKGPNGTVIPKKHQYTELASGLNYWSNGQWMESKEEINLLAQGGAAATQGQYQVYFPGNIGQGKIEMMTSDGRQFYSAPLGLSYFDGTNSIMIAEITNSVGELVAPNQVLYPNAFVGFNADLLYTYKKDGFEQDVILRTQPPTPEACGLNPATTRLQVLTEFFNSPQPAITETPLPAQAGVALTDQTLDFGTMQMIPGRAFLLGANARVGQALVSKRWLLLNGSQFLVEEVPVEALATQLATLPVTQQVSANVGIKTTQSMVLRKLQFSSQHLAKAGVKGQSIRLVQSAKPTTGVVLDYQTVSGYINTNFTFKGDTTYFISSPVTLNTTSAFEGGAVIKFPTNSSITVANISGLNWMATAYRPVVFTAQDDDSVGESISGSTGIPSGYYASTALNIIFGNNPSPVLSNFRIAYATVGINIGTSSADTIYNGQFINCQIAIELSAGAGVALFKNVMFANIQTNFWKPDGTFIMENVTFANIANFAQSNIRYNLTNCILANVTNFPVAGTITGSYNGFYNSHAYGINQITNTSYPFQTVGAGSYYLTNGCSFHAAGTTNIYRTLLTNLQQTTTYPPIIYSNTVISTAMTFSPQVQRDTNSAPDLGYHYVPLDFVFGGTTALTNLVFTPGTAVGWFELPGSGGPGYGISLSNDVIATFIGTVTSPCIFTRYDSVQEGGNGLWTDKGWLAGLEDGGNLDPSNPAGVTASFTRFIHLAGDPNLFRDGTVGQPIVIQATNCEFYGSVGGYNILAGYTNCLFYRAGFGVTTASAYPYQFYVNCTFYGGILDFGHWEGGAPYWYSYIHNCAFDNTTFIIDDPFGSNTNYADYNYNAFNQSASQLPTEGASTIIVTNGFNWKGSWLGNFYEPTNSPLIDAGDRTANQVGLFLFTTQTNQVVEGGSTVDIGYHYVTTDSNGIPITADSDGDGVPNYEDANPNDPTIGILTIMIDSPTNGMVLQ